MSNILVADVYSDALVGVIVLYFFIWLISALIWGFIVRAVARNRGYYNDNSFWWGFFLGLIGLIVILTRPDRRSYQTNPQYYGNYTQPGFWICQNCGTQNNMSNTCITCGRLYASPNATPNATPYVANVGMVANGNAAGQAKFCTKCGSQISAGASFCTTCGTQV